MGPQTFLYLNSTHIHVKVCRPSANVGDVVTCMTHLRTADTPPAISDLPPYEWTLLEVRVQHVQVALTTLALGTPGHILTHL